MLSEYSLLKVLNLTVVSAKSVLLTKLQIPLSDVGVLRLSCILQVLVPPSVDWLSQYTTTRSVLLRQGVLAQFEEYLAKY